MIRSHASQLIDRYDVRGGGPALPARQLSGGNLQKVVLAREFEGRPRILVAASPTRGLDVAAIETVHRYLREAAEGYVGVLLISRTWTRSLLSRTASPSSTKARSSASATPVRRRSRRSGC